MLPLYRLSEPTLLGTVAEIEKLYRINPRHHVTSVVSNLLVAALWSLLFAALYKQILEPIYITQRIVDGFDKNYEKNKLGISR